MTLVIRENETIIFINILEQLKYSTREKSNERLHRNNNVTWTRP